jgi:diguanylate cyclase (GGDEF)-like protein
MDDKIVVVDDDPGTIYLIGRILFGLSDLRFATSGENALRMIHDAKPDLILLDAELPGMSGFKVFDALQECPDALNVPIIFITSHNEAGFEVSALQMGAVDFIAKPFTSSRLLARVKTHLRIKRTADELRRIGSVDALTGLGSRHQFDESLVREWLRGLRVGDPISLLLIDIDQFSQYNERYGRAKGDSCLRKVAAAIKSITRRPADFVARCGGEQFGVLLPQTPRRGAEYIAHRVLDAISALNIPHEGPFAAHHVTASIGVSCYDEDSACWLSPSATFRSDDASQSVRVSNNLLLAADKALYSAKLAGRSHARLLDIAELEAPFLTRDIEPAARAERHEKMGLLRA